MRRALTPRTHLEDLKKEAKRWLGALRAGDAAARARLARVFPNAPDSLGLRDIQHALALEHGLPGWALLKTALAELQPHVDDSARAIAIQALLAGAARGDIARVSAILDAHPDVVSECGLLPGHSGMRTALHFAINGPHEAIVRLLLECGADPNVRCEGDAATPLHFAAEREHLGIIRLLIEHGADPIGHGDYHELEVIGWATCFGTARKDVVDYLLAHGARHNVFSAVATGNVDRIRALAAQSPDDLDRRMDLTNQRRRPLHLAVVKQQPASLTTLLQLGAPTEALDEAGLTPLDQAALSGEAVMAASLLHAGAEVRLPAAVALGRTADIARLLRDDPACLRPGHRWGHLILRACERGSGRLVEMLTGLGASVDVRDDPKTSVDGTYGYTPLHVAGFRGNVEAATVLLKHGADVAAREDKYCGTPAGWANYAGHTDVRDLILTGAIDLFEAIDFDLIDRIPGILDRDPEALDRPFGHYVTGRPNAQQWWPDAWCTPLAVAVLKNKVAIARVLIERGADLAVRDPDGRALRDLAHAPGREGVAALFP